MNNIFTRLARMFSPPTPTQAAKTLATISAEKRRASAKLRRENRPAWVAAHCKAIRESMK
jgi:hypothetical protein